MDLEICEHSDFRFATQPPPTLWHISSQTQAQPEVPVVGSGRPWLPPGGCKTRPSMAWLGLAWPGLAQFVLAQLSLACLGPAGEDSQVSKGSFCWPLRAQPQRTSAAHVLFIYCLEWPCEWHGKSDTFSQSVPRAGRIDSWRKPYIRSAK